MHKIYRAAIASVAVLIWLRLGGERSPAQTLSQLPPIVAQEVAYFMRGCRAMKQNEAEVAAAMARVKEAEAKGEYGDEADVAAVLDAAADKWNVPTDAPSEAVRLDEFVYQISLSGPGMRDYVVDMAKAPSRCGYCGATGLCGFYVFLNPTPGRWVRVKPDAAHGDSHRGWYTVRRSGRTLLVRQYLCDGGTTKVHCATLYRASGGSLVEIDDSLACLSSGARQRKGSSSKQPKHEGHCAATATPDNEDYHHCRQQCGQPFSSKRR